jgi:hypothetical protein
VAVSGTHAYVTTADGLQVIDVTNPLHPQIAGSVDTRDWAQGVAVSGSHAYVADDQAGLQVIDVTNPQDPQIVGSVDTPGRATGVASAGTHAYVADGGAGLQVLPAQCEGTAGLAKADGVEAQSRLEVLPNPSSREIAIRFEALNGGLVQASVYDLAGRCVRRLLDGFLSGGKHNLAWDGRDDAGVAVPAGIYLARVSTAAGTTTTRSVIIR